jgi:predicted DNA-binding protein
MKTLAIRLDEQMHTQLTVVAQLSGTTVTDAIRQAIQDYIDGRAHDPDLAGQAQTVLRQMEDDIAARRTAIATLFGPPPPT